MLSAVAVAEGRVEEAVHVGREAVAAARLVDDPGTLGWALLTLGIALWHAGDLDEATSALEEALALFQGLGGVWGESVVVMNLAGAVRAEGDLQRAARRLEEGKRISALWRLATLPAAARESLLIYAPLTAFLSVPFLLAAACSALVVPVELVVALVVLAVAG